MKLKAISYRMILQLILPIIVLILFACYQFAFKTTLESYRSYTSLKEAAGGFSKLSVSPGYTTSRVRKIGIIYAQYKVDTIVWKNELWNCGAGLSRKFNCSITTFPAVKTVVINDKKVYKQSIGFKGDFTSLLKLLNEMEHTKNIGKLNSVSYTRKNNDTETALMVELAALGERN